MCIWRFPQDTLRNCWRYALSVVHSDSEALLQTVKNLQTAINSIEGTKSSINTKYQQLASVWNDKKYAELGDVVQECTKSFNSILKTLLQGQKYVALLAKSIQQYESINLDGGANGSGMGFVSPNSYAGCPKQTEHRGLLSGREKQLAGIVDDIQRGSGRQITVQEAEKMLDSIHNYSADGYSEIRYAYRNPNASPELVTQLQMLDTYIHNAPKWEGTVYRGINVSETTARSILNNGDVDMLGPSSWSSEENVAREFARGDEMVNLVFVLNDNVSGASITHIATYNGGESEVLAPSGVRYGIDQTREVYQGNQRYIYVDVHEL